MTLEQKKFVVKNQAGMDMFELALMPNTDGGGA